MFVSAVMLIENVTTSDRQKISTTELPIAKRVDSYTCFTHLDADDYWPFVIRFLGFKSCSTDVDCKDAKSEGYLNAWTRDGEYPFCFSRQAGADTSIEEPAICCNKWALYEKDTTLGVGTKAPQRPIVAKKANGLLNEFCSIQSSNYEICSTDKDCNWYAGGDESRHHYCVSREEGPSICCEKLAMLLPSVETISTKPLPIAKRVDSYTCFKKFTFGKKVSSGFKYCSTDADCEDSKIPGLYAGQKEREYPYCFRRKAAGAEAEENSPICCSKWALYD